jgi:hypothetical protein
MRHALAIAAALFCVLGCSCGRDNGPASTERCVSGLWELGDNKVAVRVLPTMEISVRLAAIGCRRDLDRITPGQRQQITVAVEALIVRTHLGLLVDARRPEVGFEMSNEINKILGADVVRGAMIYDVSMVEFAPE